MTVASKSKRERDGDCHLEKNAVVSIFSPAANTLGLHLSGRLRVHLPDRNSYLSFYLSICGESESALSVRLLWRERETEKDRH